MKLSKTMSINTTDGEHVAFTSSWYVTSTSDQQEVLFLTVPILLIMLIL